MVSSGSGILFRPLWRMIFEPSRSGRGASLRSLPISSLHIFAADTQGGMTSDRGILLTLQP